MGDEKWTREQSDGTVTAFLPIHEDGTFHVEAEVMHRLMCDAGWRRKGGAQ